MEKEKFYMGEEASAPIWKSCNFGMEMQGNEVNNVNSFLNANWDNSMDQSDPFESALSSIVSSPAASSANVSNANGIPTGCGGRYSVMIRELIGRLGSICNSGEISPQSYMNNNNSTDTSCYSTPLNSPPKLNLSMMDSSQMRGNLPILGNNFGNHPSLAPFPADPAFVERAARYSCFGSRNLGQLGLNETDFPQRLMPRISSNQSMKVSAGSQVTTVEESNKNDGNLISSDKKKLSKLLSRSSTPEKNAEVGDSREESSVSEQIPGGELSKKSQNDATTGRKRKSIPKGKAKETPSSSPAASDAKENEASAKRSKSEEGNDNEKEAGKTKEDQNENQKQNKDNPKPPEPPKDYIHVRARRGQATDSHSLAERVRREKISERMKFLQDLVPGCNKVTGKAVMLDEIINYVQSLQRQVEFLSMKLSTVNPRTDFNIESLLSKDSFQSHGSMQQNNLCPLDSSVSAFHYGYQPQHGLSLHNGMSANAENQLSMNSLSALLRRNPNMQLPPLDGFADAARQMGFGEDDLQSVVQMGFVPNQQQSFHGSVPSAQMKVEL